MQPLNAGKVVCLPVGSVAFLFIRLLYFKDQLLAKFEEVIGEWYGTDPQKSSDLCRIINIRHFQ